MTDIFARLQAAAHAGAFGVNEQALPTAEQCKAGNYAKGRVRLHGMPVAIEVPQGQRRMGKSDGKPWSTILMAHYGYLVGTKAADGDALDVFVGPVPESTKVWVVNQVGKAGEFDEHKILLGFLDEASARAAYMNSYERGWTGLGSLVACTMFQLKWWVKYGNTTKPLTEQALPHDGNTDMNETVWDSAAEPVGCDFADLIYRLRRDDDEGLMLDAVSLADIMETSEGEEALDALVVQYNKAERKAEQLRRIMESVGGEVTPASVQVTPPFKQRGTTNVVFLYELSDGQTVSIWMHNPDSTPNKILPQDELVSWRWMLNKKDITLLVAPERGQDLNPREVSRRIMKLAQRNSARFAKANASRAERMQNIDGLKGSVAAKEAELAALDKLFADLTEKVEAKRSRKPATLQTNDQEDAGRGDVSTPEGQGERSKAVKAELAKLGWDATPGSLVSMLTIDRSVYSLRSDQSGKTGIVWRDEGSNESWSDDGTLTAAAMAAKIDGEFRQGIARAQDMLNFDPTTPEGYEKATQDEALQIAHQDQLDSFFQGRIIEVRNALRDLGWEGERYKPLSKTASNGDVWKFEPRYKQVGAGANIVEFYPQLYIYRDGKKVENENWATEDRLTLTAQEMAALIDSVVPQATTEPVEDEAADLVPDGRENIVKTAKGTKVVTGFKVVEASRLIVSHDIDGNPNPDYPHELQPRDRARATSQAWVQKTARSLDPDSLGRTQRADSGAPIVGPDRVVESGNGRTMAIKEAYRLKQADEYRAWLIGEAGYFGLDAAKIERMKAPVLVRVRTSDVDRATFAVEANQDDKLAMTATEKARSDAKRLTDAVIVKMAADGDLLAAGNRDFIAAFLQSLGEAEAAQYLTSNGQPTASLIARLQAAIFAKAYNDDRLLELTADSAKPEIASIINALNIAAPDFIRAQSADRASAEDAASKIADSVDLSLNQQAVAAIIGATGVLKHAKDSGLTLDEFLRQGDMFGDIDPAVAAMAVFISKNNRSAKRMGVAFKAMAEFVQGEIEKRQSASLFGDDDSANFADIVAAANRKLEQEYGEGAFAIDTTDLFAKKDPALAQTHSEWEGEVTELIAEKLGITTSDAQGMVEAQPFYMQQSWGKGMSAQETADKIMAESRAPEDEQIQHAREFLQSVIDGQVDFMDEGLAERLEQIHDDYAGDEDVMALFGAAAQAYSDYMVEQARAALA